MPLHHLFFSLHPTITSESQLMKADCNPCPHQYTEPNKLKVITKNPTGLLFGIHVEENPLLMRVIWYDKLISFLKNPLQCSIPKISLLEWSRHVLETNLCQPWAGDLNKTCEFHCRLNYIYVNIKSCTELHTTEEGRKEILLGYHVQTDKQCEWLITIAYFTASQAPPLNGTASKLSSPSF